MFLFFFCEKINLQHSLLKLKIRYPAKQKSSHFRSSNPNSSEPLDLPSNHP